MLISFQSNMGFSSRTQQIRSRANKDGKKLSYREARLQKPVNRLSYLSTSYDDFNERLKKRDMSFDFLFRHAYGKLKEFRSKGEKNVFFNIPVEGFSQYAIRVKRKGLKLLRKLLEQERPHRFEITQDKKHVAKSGLPIAKIVITNKKGQAYVVEDGITIFGEVMPFVPGKSLAQLARTVGYMGSRKDSDPFTHLTHSDLLLNRLLKLKDKAYIDLLTQMKASQRHPDLGLGNIILTPGKRLVMIDPHSGYINALEYEGEAKFMQNLTTRFNLFLHEECNPIKKKKVLARFQKAFQVVFNTK